MPCTPEAVDVLRKANVLIAPAIAAGAGGVGYNTDHLLVIHALCLQPFYEQYVTMNFFIYCSFFYIHVNMIQYYNQNACQQTF